MEIRRARGREPDEGRKQRNEVGRGERRAGKSKVSVCVVLFYLNEVVQREPSPFAKLYWKLSQLWYLG